MTLGSFPSLIILDFLFVSGLYLPHSKDKDFQKNRFANENRRFCAKSNNRGINSMRNPVGDLLGNVLILSPSPCTRVMGFL